MIYKIILRLLYKFVRIVQKFFFEYQSALNLGISRFLYFGLLFFIFLDEPFSLWGTIPEIYFKPIPLFEYLHIPYFGPNTLGVMGFFWLLSLLFSSLGFFTRFSMVVAFVLGFYYIGLTKNFKVDDHTFYFMVIILGVMAFSRAGDGFSIDSWMRRRGWAKPIKKTLFQGEYRWPVRLIWVLMALMFCAAGFTKLRISGLEWITSGHLADYLILFIFKGDRGEPLSSEFTLWLAGKPFIYYTLSAATIILEAGAPLALLSGYLRAVLIPLLFLMVLCFWIIMGIPFPELLASFVFWVPWDSIANKFNLINTTSGK